MPGIGAVPPAIQGFQDAASFSPDGDIPVAPGKGWLLVLEERSMQSGESREIGGGAN